VNEPHQKIRIDKWLWQSRHFKTRTNAAKAVSGGHVRVNSRRVLKPSFAVGIGDVLAFRQGKGLRVVRVVALTDRRGPSAEALALYEDLARSRGKTAARPEPSSGRPNRKERRIAAQLKLANLD